MSHTLINLIDSISDKIPEGTYIKIMNELLKIHKQIQENPKPPKFQHNPDDPYDAVPPGADGEFD